MSTHTPEGGQHLILYDGVCGLCNRTIGIILPRDPESRFRFASLQSELGRSLLLRNGRNPNNLDTFLVLLNYCSSTPELLAGARAALFITEALGGFWRSLTIFAILPDFILDRLYSLVARNRYRVFGRYDRCLMPDATYKSRFIDI